jgi:hypothetical protein
MSDLEFEKMALLCDDSAEIILDSFPTNFPRPFDEHKKQIKTNNGENSKLFSCKVCLQIFDFTSIEALKHKKNCRLQ